MRGIITRHRRRASSTWAACVALAFFFTDPNAAPARDPKPSSPPSGAYDPSIDVARLNAFLKGNCYLESASPRAPSGLVQKTKCTGQVDDKGLFTVNIDGGYGLSGQQNGFVIITWKENWKIDWRRLQHPWWVAEDGIVLFCQSMNESCASVTLIYYSEDGKRVEAQAHDEKRSSGATIPVNIPKSQIVEEFLRPFERLITPSHTDQQTCYNNKCAS